MRNGWDDGAKRRRWCERKIIVTVMAFIVGLSTQQKQVEKIVEEYKDILLRL